MSEAIELWMCIEHATSGMVLARDALRDTGLSAEARTLLELDARHLWRELLAAREELLRRGHAIH